MLCFSNVHRKVQTDALRSLLNAAQWKCDEIERPFPIVFEVQPILGKRTTHTSSS